MTKPHNSEESSFDGFLRDEGMYEEVAGAAAARVLAWQLQEQMREQLSKRLGMEDPETESSGDTRCGEEVPRLRSE